MMRNNTINCCSLLLGMATFVIAVASNSFMCIAAVDATTIGPGQSTLFGIRGGSNSVAKQQHPPKKSSISTALQHSSSMSSSIGIGTTLAKPQEEEIVYVTKRNGTRELFDSQKVCYVPCVICYV
jgi:hypothetical protein